MIGANIEYLCISRLDRNLWSTSKLVRGAVARDYIPNLWSASFEIWGQRFLSIAPSYWVQSLDEEILQQYDGTRSMIPSI